MATICLFGLVVPCSWAGIWPSCLLGSPGSKCHYAEYVTSLKIT